MRFVGKWIARIEQLWMYVAAIALFAMMMVTVVDVALRYVWNSPLGWSQEVITLYFLAAAFFMALSATLEDNVHIRIDIISRYASARTKAAMAIAVYAIAFVFFALIFQQGFLRTIESWASGQTYPGFIQWPSWVTEIFVPLGVGLIELRIAYRFVVSCLAFARKEYDIVETMESEHGDPEEESL